MRLSFDDDQLAFRDAVRELLAKECPPSAVRQPTTAAWNALAEMGALSLTAPESDGGLGLDERYLVLVLEEAGYAGLPQPIVETAAVAAPIIGDRGDGDAIIASDLGGPVVPWAAEADQLLLADGEGGLALVPRAAAELEPVKTVDHARHGSRVVAVRDGGRALDADLELAFDRGAWGTAAFLIGLSRRMLDMTVAYVVEREQFGVPIGSFQAVKHHLADAAAQLAFARPVVYQAAWSLAVEDGNRSRDVSTAKAMASDAAVFVGRKALQCHGAIGFTTEADLHLFQKRSWALARTWGDAAWHRDRIGQSLGI
jgi:alkylation response protein AidB-like acyl-CoA dehydrogenase